MLDPLSACDLCGDAHITSACAEFEPKVHLPDRTFLSRARMTLPSSLCWTDENKTSGIITLAPLQEGTQFGPFEAPRRGKLKDKPKLLLSVFDSVSECEYLDTSDEKMCNWLCLVRPVNSLEESNLMAFQANRNIFFRVWKEIKEGQELLVFYSAHYSKKIDYILQNKNVLSKKEHKDCAKCPIHCPRLTSLDCDGKKKNRNHSKRKSLSSKLKRKPGRPIKIENYDVHLPPGSTHECEVRLLPKESISLPNKDKWRCSQCSVVYDDGLKFALHFQKHFSSKHSPSNSRSKVKTASSNERNIPQECINKSQELERGFDLAPVTNSKVSKIDVESISESNHSYSDSIEWNNKTQESEIVLDQIHETKCASNLEVSEICGESNSSMPLKCKVRIEKLPEKMLKELLKSMTNSASNLFEPQDSLSKLPSDQINSQDTDVTDTILKLPKKQGCIFNSSFKMKITNEQVGEVELPVTSSELKAVNSEEMGKKVSSYNLRTERKILHLSESEDSNVSIFDHEDYNEDMSDSDEEYKIRINEKPEAIVKVEMETCEENSSGNSMDFRKIEEKDSKERSQTQESCNEPQGTHESDNSGRLESLLKDFENALGNVEDGNPNYVSSASKESVKRRDLTNGVKNKRQKRNCESPNSSTYECDICGKTFSSSFYLFRHTKKHTGDFSCFLCKKAFARKESLLKHNCKGKPSSLQCLKCNRTFCAKRLLEKHMNLHNRPFKCEECRKDFTSKDMLLKHACSNSKRVVTCPVCKKVFSNLYLMAKHLPVHTGQFSCPLCSKWLCSSSAAYSHLLICRQVTEITENGTKQCPTCQKVFTTVKDYRAHEFTHTHSFECKHCTGHFISLNKIENHHCIEIRVPCPYCNKMFDGIPAIQSHSCIKFPKPYQCLLCKDWYKKREDLQKHECSCDIQDLKKSLSPHKSDLLICDQCGKTFASVSSLNAHKVTHGERKFTCTLCDKMFHRKDQLESHNLIHGGPTVPCSQCGKLFKCKRSMAVHLRTHFGIKAFSCAICFKSFHQKGNLLKHQETHIEGRSYICSDCGKVYKSKEAFVKHQKVHQQGNSLICMHCDKTFIDKSQLKSHINVAHLNQAYICKYCGISTRMRHSMTRHLSRKHSDLESEWKNPDVVSSMCSRKLNKAVKSKVVVKNENSEDEADTQETTDNEGEMMFNEPGFIVESHKLEDLLCVEEVVQSTLHITSDIQDESEMQLEIPLQCDSDNIQKQVVVSNTIQLNDHQIEELRQKFQEEHAGTVILEDGTVIQQQPAMCGSSDVIFYVIPKDSNNS